MKSRFGQNRPLKTAAALLLGGLLATVALSQVLGINPQPDLPPLRLAQSNATMPPAMTAPSRGEPADAVNRGELVMRTSFLVFREAHRNSMVRLELRREARRRVQTLDRNYESAMEKAMIMVSSATNDEGRRRASDRIQRETKTYAAAFRDIVGQETYVLYSRIYAEEFARIDQNQFMELAEREIRARRTPPRSSSQRIRA
ncbi:MAG: hypothetical protein MUC92_04495 [Fimbriimonadaceae bacterium]|nr:hypothetical protein [Fimbriimonadaceae bacterium]